jgi:plastocyanin
LPPRTDTVGVSRIALTLVVVVMVAVAGFALYAALGTTNAPTDTHTSSQAGGSSTVSAVGIALNPAAPVIAPGQTQNYSSIVVSGTAANGSLSLELVAPPGLSFLPNMTSVSLSSSPQSISLVIKAAPGLSTGKYRVTVEAKSTVVSSENRTFSVQVVPALVLLQALAFHPQNITVPLGTNMTWINLDSNIGCCDPGYHTVVFVSGANASSPQMKRFDTWSYQFNAAGEVDYFCSIHPYMKGQVTVTG